MSDYDHDSFQANTSAVAPLLRSKWFVTGFLAAAVTGSLVLAFPAPNLPYVIGVLAHAALGIALLPLGWRTYRRLRSAQLTHIPAAQKIFWGLFLLSAAFGCYLLLFGNTRVHAGERWAHILVSALLLAFVLGALYPTFYSRSRSSRRCLAWSVAGICLGAILVPAAKFAWRSTHPDPAYYITNPSEGFTSMQAETSGEGAFFPSSSHTRSKAGLNDPLLPERFFENSQACGRCHTDIYKQWESSMHHFASFNNQFYRASIEYMQSVQGTTRPSQWCAACHDSAVLFTGKWKTPIRQQIHTPAAQAGLGCLSCHAIIHVKDTIGNSAFTVEDPPLHDLVESNNRFLKLAHDTVLYLQPAPHDMTFLKPFHTAQTAQFCSACHKVHLDVPVNHYRWSRGFDEYDNWQGSGVSGEGARSFYYPPRPQDCAGCHMPLLRSSDPAARNGMIHSHRFPAANTAVAFANGDQEQLQAEEKFLKGSVSTDIFAIARGGEPAGVLKTAKTKQKTPENAPTEQSMFARGEESGSFGATTSLQRGPAVAITAPLDRTRPELHPGESVRVDVVERTQRLGHFFPGGTIDAFEVWLEFKATDAAGKTFFWSGDVRPDGAIDPGAHFYRALLVDAHGNPINKRNAWAARSTIYVHLIPPGAADTVRYRVTIPADVKGPVTFEAKLRYRKFSRDYTRFAYAGVSHDTARRGDPAVTLDYDDRPMTFDGPTNDVSGKIKTIPNLPIATISNNIIELPVAGQATAAPPLPQAQAAPEHIRWNDYGIGLFLEGDLTGAEQAFRKVTQVAPQYADGWLNVARVLIQEGETDAARQWVEKALALNPTMARTHYFRGLIRKTTGDYDGALTDMQAAIAQFPRDRVVLNQIGRLLFLKRQYAEAVSYLLRSTAIDPENIEAHYNLMLCYRGLGDIRKSAREQAMYWRFKADEASQAIAGAYLRAHPDDNNERQPVHEHSNDRVGLNALRAERSGPILMSSSQ